MVFLVFLVSLAALEVVLRHETRKYPLKPEPRRADAHIGDEQPVAAAAPADGTPADLLSLARALDKHGTGAKPGTATASHPVEEAATPLVKSSK